MVKTQISAISLLFMAFMLACSGSAKISQGNDGSAGVYRPNDLTSASAQISASSGGYINVGKAQLRIPAQALESDTTITAEVADIQLPAGGAKAIGKGIRLKPEGLQFLKPAELMLCYSATEAAALQAQGAQVYYHTDDNQYVAIAGTVDTATNCVSSHIEHFSSYVAAAYLQLPGNTAPNIGGANFLPTTPLAGVPLRVRTAINDTNGSTPIGTTVPGTVVTAFLYYRTVGSPTFTKVALQSDTTDDTVTNRYYYLIPGNEVTTAGIEYYFEATDNLNAMRRLPAAAGSFSTRTVPTAATGIRFAPVAANSKLEISAGFNRALTLQATDNGTTWQNISADNFALTNASLGSAVRSGPSTIRFSAIGAGAGQLTSTIGALSTAIDITVVPGLLTHIEITDMNQVALTGTLQLPISQAYDLDVVGYDAYGNVAQVYPVFTATGGVGSVTIDAAGAHLLTGAAVASGSVIADIAGLTDSISVSLYVPPQVTATAPFDNTTGIALNSSIGVSFSHIMDTSTLTTTTTSACVGSLQVSSDNFTTCVPMASATPSFFASDTLAVIQPAASLSGTTTYKIRVTTAARNTSGYPLSAIYTTPTGFTTAAAPV
ncbi:MAG TPA: Ig-like domain-containing protein, partial [Turneriella sp.]|nr:Ig-like domain-containing protein [Turneriella sp.]